MNRLSDNGWPFQDNAPEYGKTKVVGVISLDNEGPHPESFPVSRQEVLQ
jgi:hypothetical protein